MNKIDSRIIILMSLFKKNIDNKKMNIYVFNKKEHMYLSGIIKKYDLEEMYARSSYEEVKVIYSGSCSIDKKIDLFYYLR